jgi:hypothetical protein
MNPRLDEKRLKTLSDILALVLVDQPGESAAALEAVRRKAQQDGITGGALKDIFQQVRRLEAGQDDNAGAGPAASPQPSMPPRSATQLRAALQDMQRRYVEAKLFLDRERRSNAELRGHLRILQDGVSNRTRPPARFGRLEQELARVDALELELQRRALDLRTMQKELTNERQRTRLAVVAGRRRFRRSWQVIAASVGLFLLVSDGAARDLPGDDAASAPTVACAPGRSAGHDMLCL